MTIARRVMMIIGFIAALGLSITLALIAIVFFIATNNEELLTKLLDGLNKSTMTLNEGKNFALSTGLFIGFYAFIEILNTIFTLIGIKSNKTIVMIFNIILGLVGSTYINTLGGIFGLCEDKKN